jgi:hypothetical protein
MANAQGTIVQSIGAVIDIEFPREGMPKVYDALVLEDSDTKSFAEKGLTFEVEQQLGDGVVRCIALGSRTMPAARHEGARHRRTDLGAGGEGTLGRIMDVLGRPIDEAGPIQTTSAARSTSRRPSSTSCPRPSSCSKPASRSSIWSARSPRAARSACSAAPAWQDRQHDGADQQHRQAARRAVGVRRRGRAHA